MENTSIRSGQEKLTTASDGWSTMAQAVKEVDKQKLKDIKEDIDTLLVFVRVFMFHRSCN